MICYRRATLEDLEQLWAYTISQNPEEPRNLRWKESFISRNIRNEAATYVTVIDNIPVAEVTLDFFAAGYGNVESRPLLADGKQMAYVTALRIRPEYEGMGYVSGLMKFLEASAKKLGFTRLTIGVEASNTRNLGIYLHWGYDQFIWGEPDDGELTLFYAKKL